MPSSPPTLPSLHPHSFAFRLPRLVVMLPFVLHHLRFLSCHCLPSGGASTCPLLVVSLPLVVPLFFSGAVTSRPPQLFVVSPLVTPTASCPHAPLPFIALLPLIVPLLCLLPSWLSCCLSSCQHLLSARASNSHCAIASCFAPLVPLVHFGWLFCSLS
jgi:hypothetical protein